jgi:hypothetical protein
MGAMRFAMCGGDECGALDGRADRAALVVPEHDDERDAQHGHRVLEAAEHGVGDDLAGVADHEEVAEALVEDDLGREARVAAAEQRGGGALHVREGGAALDVLARVAGLAGDEAGVALHHLGPHLGGCLHGLVLVGHPSVPSPGAVVLVVSVPGVAAGVGEPAEAPRAAATASMAVRSSFASAVP